MKVIISKQFENSMRRLFSDEPLYVVRRFVDNILRFLRQEIPWAWQRATKGIDDSMTFSLDSYLAKHIGILLAQYYKDANCFIMIDEKHKRWIKDTIKAFKEYQKFDSLEVFHNLKKKMSDKDAIKEMNKRGRDIRRRMSKLFNENYPSLWW